MRCNFLVPNNSAEFFGQRRSLQGALTHELKRLYLSSNINPISFCSTPAVDVSL